MLLKKPLLLLLLLFCCTKAFAATFVVTSNADSGPGTLRDALTQAAANGTTDKDYITFNLPSNTLAAITITINSQLPFITSNIIIDGTTQPGSALGVSNAKVILQPDISSEIFNPFVLINVSGFEIYGMNIRDFIGVGPFELSAVFYARVSDNIIIGAPGKGNVISNCGFILSDRAYYSGTYVPGYSVNNLTVSSNFFGFEPDGKTVRGTALGYVGGIDISSCEGNIIIGGDNVSQRNIFGNGAQYIEDVGAVTGKSTILIKNNYLNYDINGNPVPNVNMNASEIYGIFITDPGNSGVTDYPYDVTITDNNIKYPLQIIVDRVTGKIVFQGNKLLNDPAEIHGYGPGIGLWGDAGVLIGGEQPGQPNVLYGSPIRANSSTSVLLHRNSIYCVNVNGTYAGAPPNPIYMTNTYQDPKLPIINIDKATATGISGTATPLSQVELFQDDDCVWCEPLTYFATVNTDANGNWSYNGPLSKGVIASATLNGYTSLFTTSGFLNSFNIINSACGDNGVISGLDISNSGGYTITDAKGVPVSINGSAQHLPPGMYTITTNNSTCAAKYTLSVLDATPAIIASGIQIVQPGCGNKDGSITGLTIGYNNYEVLQNDYNAYTYAWKDAGGNTVASNAIDLTGVGPGAYTLEMTYVKNGCTQSYGPITLKNTSGPNIDQSSAKIQSTNCGQSTGSITNITATGNGNLKYNWTNSLQQTVGDTKDLTNQPAGTYKLEVTDQSSCGAVYTSDIIIPETNGITMDESAATLAPSSCKNNGSVTGIKVSGATQYQWTDANNKTVGTQPDLTGVPAGTYILTASNAYGCSKTSRAYTVQPVPPTVYPNYAFGSRNTCADSPTGFLTIATDDLVASLRWVDSQGNVKNTPTVNNVPAGTYSLYLTDKNGCESFYNSYTIYTIPQLEINPQNLATVTDDECNTKTGGINNMGVAGGVQPYKYAWTDASGNTITTSPVLMGVGAGTYTLTVTDASVCGLATASFTVNNIDNIIPPPSVNNVQLCTSGSVMIAVNNASATGVYNLYSDANSTTPVQQATGGKFKVDLTGNASFYITQVNGTCESGKAKVDVTVGLSALNIANTFTPNGDGINDYWKINNIENYPNAVVQIFTRDGQKIFESKGYQVPFDGTYKGQKLPVGVYYFIINLNSNCSLLSGSLTILR